DELQSQWATTTFLYVVAECSVWRWHDLVGPSVSFRMVYGLVDEETHIAAGGLPVVRVARAVIK
ncbi:unnamed protein product, partial [Choristocarpus tenellus]